MYQCDALVSIGIAVYVHEFEWVYAYLYCGCTTSDDTPLFNVSGWKELDHFPRGQNKYNETENIIQLVYRAVRGVVSGRESIQQENLVLCISRFRSILIIPSRNRGEEGKGGYRSREDVLPIDLGDYSE